MFHLKMSIWFVNHVLYKIIKVNAFYVGHYVEIFYKLFKLKIDIKTDDSVKMYQNLA